MGWRPIMAGAAILLSLLGCQGGEQGRPEGTASVEQATTTVGTSPESPARVLTAEEKLLRRIRSCKVRWVVFAHDDLTYVSFADGGGSVRLRLGDGAFRRVYDAAEMSERTCRRRTSVGIE
jgi:hypothetical protein